MKTAIDYWVLHMYLFYLLLSHIRYSYFVQCGYKGCGIGYILFKHACTKISVICVKVTIIIKILVFCVEL